MASPPARPGRRPGGEGRGRALVTANIKDFVPLDSRYRAAGQPHSGLILVPTKTFPQNRGFPSAITTALATLLSGTAKIQPGQVLFLTREGMATLAN